MELMQLRAYLTVYLRNGRFREMFEAMWINRKRVLFILRKLLSRVRTDPAASSSWLEGSAKPQILSP